MKKILFVVLTLFGLWVAVGCSSQNLEKANVKDLQGMFYTLYADPKKEIQRAEITFSKDGHTMEEKIIYQEDNPNNDHPKKAKKNLDKTYSAIKITTKKDQYTIDIGDRVVIYKKIGKSTIEDENGVSYSRTLE